MRGSGRTRAMVMGLPEGGATVVVHTARMRDYVRRMIRDLRGPCVAHLVDVVAVETLRDAYRLQGAMRPLFVDHTVAEVAPRAITETLRALGTRGYGMNGVEPGYVPCRSYSIPETVIEAAFAAGELMPTTVNWRDVARIATIETSTPVEGAELAAAVELINASGRHSFEAVFVGMDLGAGDDRTVLREMDLRPGAINYVRSGAVRVGLPDTRWRELNYEWRPDIGDLTNPYAATREAAARAESLLREWLSPEQAEQLDIHRHFEVTGSDTGTRYRIERGRVQNVFALDREGKPAQGWCFAPAGSLAEGDVMLAQKIALETQEKKALARANRFFHQGIDDFRLMRDAVAWQYTGDPLDDQTPEDETLITRVAEPIDAAAWTGRP